MGTSIISPVSVLAVTQPKVFPNIYDAGTGNFRYLRGLGWMASLDGDAYWELAFKMPPTLPDGTAKFSGWLLANAESGSSKLNIKWASAALGEDYSGLTLQAEGVQTHTWASGDPNKPKEILVTLDGDTIVAGEMVVMQVYGETSGWTLAEILTLIAPCIKFE